jgi:hypothetical protein
MEDTDAAVSPEPQQDEEEERGATLWMSLGLALFGFAVGFTTGLSVHEGISSSLLSSLFSFAGGTILAFAGFSRVLRGTGKLVMSTRRVGLGLLSFAVGVLLGQPTGIILRVVGDQWAQRCAPVAAWLSRCDLGRLEAHARNEARALEFGAEHDAQGLQVQAERDLKALQVQAERDLKFLQARAALELELRRLASQVEATYHSKDRSALSALSVGAPESIQVPKAGDGSMGGFAPADPEVDKIRARAGAFVTQGRRAPLCEEVKRNIQSNSYSLQSAVRTLEELCRAP